MKKLFDLRHIFPITIAIVASLTALYIEAETIHRVILFILVALLVDIAVERIFYLKNIEDDIKSLIVATNGFLFPNRRALQVKEPFDQFLEQGQDVLIIGPTLLSTIGPYRDFLKKAVEKGTDFRFLLLDPVSSCVEPVAQFHNMSSESLRADIWSSLNHLQQLKDSVSDNRQASVQFRLLRAIPNMGIVVRDGNRSIGVIRCELYTYKSDASNRPTLRLTPTHGEIYNRYLDTAERLWDDSQH